MSVRTSQVGRFQADQAGQSTLEWTLILAVFALPMIWVIRVLLNTIVEYYHMVSFLETLPYP